MTVSYQGTCSRDVLKRRAQETCNKIVAEQRHGLLRAAGRCYDMLARILLSHLLLPAVDALLLVIRLLQHSNHLLLVMRVVANILHTSHLLPAQHELTRVWSERALARARHLLCSDAHKSSRASTSPLEHVTRGWSAQQAPRLVSYRRRGSSELVAAVSSATRADEVTRSPLRRPCQLSSRRC